MSRNSSFVKVRRRSSRSSGWRWGCLILLTLLALVLFIPYYSTTIEPTWVRLRRVTVPLAGWPAALDGLTILQITDIHLGPDGGAESLRRAAELAAAQEVDLVVLTGDFVSHDPEYILEVAQILGQLPARYGRYAVLGNHDRWTGPEMISAHLETHGFQVLRSEREALDIEGSRLWLLGIDDAGYSGLTGNCDPAAFVSYWEGERHAVADLLVGIPESEPRLLLAHNPDFAAMLLPGRIDLVISGHTHGGQVRLPFWGAVGLPSCYGKRFEAGLIEGSPPVYVSRGVGTTGLPVRFNCRPEVSLLTLVRAE